MQLYFMGISRKQIESLVSFVSSRDIFISLPTGYGKSIILVEIVSVVSQQRPHTSDLNSAIPTSLAFMSMKIKLYGA